MSSKTVNKQGQTVNTTLFPEDDKVVIKATPGFPASEYIWQYATRKDSTWVSGRWSYTYNWQQVPSALARDSILTASATDLLGSQASSFYKKNVYFRMELSCNRWTDILTLSVIPSAPHIVGATYDMPACNGELNGWVKLRFDRALFNGERLYYALKSNREYLNDPLTVDPQTFEAVIHGLPSDAYNISLQGTLPINGQSAYTYTEGSTHYYDITIPVRPKVTFTADQEAAHCFDGYDGRIRVTAQGGVGKYHADLFARDNTSVILRQLTFNENQTVRFTDLHAGDYIVQLTDSNYCHPDVPELALTVSQPAAPLSLYGLQYKEPIGFGYSDGQAWVNITGGTGTYTVVWTNQQGTQLASEPLVNAEGSSKQTRLKNIGKGTYYVYVTDQNFPLVDPRTQANECGCIAVDTIFVDEPPLLKVALSETHYVTCHGDNDGVITAHAEGGRPYLPADAKPLPYSYKWYKQTASGDSLFTQAGDSILTGLYSGYYKVKITDRNGIEALSPVFHLVQPEPLMVTAAVVKSLLCDGASSGEAEVIVTGGTEPYSYFWETGDTTRVVKGLPQGIYSVYVRDGRYLDSQTHYCSAEAHVEIKAPEGLIIKAVTKEPTCSSGADGSIVLEASGGTAPYIFRWENGADATMREGLADGTYSVLITDAGGCTVAGSYTLKEPEAVVVDLGGDVTLCKGRSTILANLTGMGGVTYRWTRNGQEVSTDSLCTATTAGVYRLTATNTVGCTAHHEITVSISDDELAADFVIASQIPNNTVVRAINIIRTPYDRIEWIMPAEAVVSEQTDDHVLFSIARNGYYSIGMAGYKGACRDMLYKRIEVLAGGEINSYDESEPFLRKFTVYPNPGSGNFNVSIELREAADYTLSLCDSKDQVIETRNITLSIGEDTLFGIPAAAGTYYLRFISKETTSVFKMVFN